MLGNRAPGMVVREALRARNYIAAANMLRRYPRRRDAFRRYFLARGEYPYACAVRTPLGLVTPTLLHPHDFWTVNEVFCREDYAADSALQVAVDIGSNIGISALYFLTRSRAVRCHCFEPVPRNADRLRKNLAAFADRMTLCEAAVADRAGRVRFGVEETGRYGGIGAETGAHIEVECLDVNAVLAGILEREGWIDLLKLDTEGSELVTVQAIAPQHLRRIGTIYFEWDDRAPLYPELFDARYANATVRLRNRNYERPAA
jgi:FkbM family methyltransferase